MAYSHFSYKSKVMNRDISMEISLPCYESAYQGEADRFRTVYFLHGHTGSAENYMTRLMLREVASARGLAVVAINGENMAYLDCEWLESQFSTWIGTELLDVTRSVFPLSDRGEDTCIAGFSMGGYGSMVNGVRFADRFGKIGVMSGGGLNFAPVHSTERLPEIMENIMGGREQYRNSYAYLPHALQEAYNERRDLPMIHMVCGTADFVYEDNAAMDRYLSEHGIAHTFTEYQGEGHTVQFINKALPELLTLLAQD